MNYYLHRISHEWVASSILFQKGFLSIGWNRVSNTNIITVVRENDDWDEFWKIMQNHDYHNVYNKNSLYRFFKFNKEDYVVVPLPEGMFSVCKVIDTVKPVSMIPKNIFDDTDLELKNGRIVNRISGKVVDIGFVVEVEILQKKLSRYSYADKKLTARMKIRHTNTDIGDLKPEIDDIIANKRINFCADFFEFATKELLNRIREKLEPNSFEHLIKWYMERIGASNVKIPPKNNKNKKDYADADIVATFDDLRIIVCIQAKFHEDKTDNWAVEQISKYVGQHNERSGNNPENSVLSWVITAADGFTPEAQEAAYKQNVILINGKEFTEMLLKVGFTNLDKVITK